MIKDLDDFRTHERALKVADEVWNIVNKWHYFAKDTVGKQFVRAVDSVAANLSEGLGRFHYGEARNFSYFARGSLYESRTWLMIAKQRKLVSENEYAVLADELEAVGRMINSYIRSIGVRSNDASEPPMDDWD